MAKISNRDKILSEGLRVVHERGFAGASVRDIVQAAGVPQGSFTNHFASKEAFGLEILDIYFANSVAMQNATLLNESLPALDRLRAYLDAMIGKLSVHAMRNGCLLGNFTAEACDHSDPIRLRLLDIFGQLQRSITHCLDAAQREGSVSPNLDLDETASFIVSSLQGAILIAKAQRNAAPVEHFKQILFSTVLR